MSIEKVRQFLHLHHREKEIIEFPVSSATVELAAKALGCEAGRIAKTLSLQNRDGGALILVMAGDCKIDNRKFKDYFGFKAKMLSGNDAEVMTGHAPGGVCPFGLPENCRVFCDKSLQRFETVFPACGSSNSAIELSADDLYSLSGAQNWIEISRISE